MSAIVTKKPIIIIEDDEDDREFISDAIAQCGISHELKFFDNGEPALQYLLKTEDQPFLIFCDINMPRMSGLELRRIINGHDDLRRKSIPFIFLTTSTSRRLIDEAYELTIQGFFKKPNDHGELCRSVQDIIEYWTKCLHPNKT